MLSSLHRRVCPLKPPWEAIWQTLLTYSTLASSGVCVPFLLKKLCQTNLLPVNFPLKHMNIIYVCQKPAEIPKVDCAAIKNINCMNFTHLLLERQVTHCKVLGYLFEEKF